jgi:hypothetical protein
MRQACCRRQRASWTRSIPSTAPFQPTGCSTNTCVANCVSCLRRKLADGSGKTCRLVAQLRPTWRSPVRPDSGHRRRRRGAERSGRARGCGAGDRHRARHGPAARGTAPSLPSLRGSGDGRRGSRRSGRELRCRISIFGVMLFSDWRRGLREQARRQGLRRHLG